MRFLTGILIVLLGAVNACGDAGNEGKSDKNFYGLETSEKAKLKEGDLLFRKGGGMVSNMISAMQETDYDVSHCGILVQKRGRFQVVSAVSSSISKHSGVHAVPLDTFVANSIAESLIVSRLSGDEPGIPKKMASTAWSYAEKQIPFDHSFALENEDKLYCTELIYKVLKADPRLGEIVKPNHTKSGKPYIGFKAFLENQHFQMVLNHQAS